MLRTKSLPTSIDMTVGMGQAVVAAEPSHLSTILGSCVAVTLYSPQRRVGMLSHIVLPKARGEVESPAKYADTAIPHMLSTLQSEGVPQRELTAKVVGGACMFGNNQISRIGDSNVQAAVAALEEVGIKVAACDAGGTSGRRVSFDLANGMITVASVGRPARTI
jgi:chemotaxis protein CheD